MIGIYRILTFSLYPFLILLIYFRKIFNKEDKIRYKEKIFSNNFNAKQKKRSKLLWFHCASIGEFKSILPILEELNKRKKNYEFLITTITLSSSKLAEEELKNFTNVEHRFFPIDVKFLIEKFLLSWKPDLIFFVDSEIWPNLIISASDRKIPLILINGRITAKSFKRWMLIPETAKQVFQKFNMCLCSNLETKNYLLQLNVRNIFYNGNIKLINKINNENTQNPNQEILKRKKFWLAASTHKGEEIFCLKTHIILKKRLGNILTIIAPRHINRSKNIEALCKKFDLNSQIINRGELISEDKEVVIINSFGILQNYFKFSNSVFIGKSTIKKLENVGGQNPIDAVRFGCKIYHGPYVYNFKEVYEILEKQKISKQVNNIEELSANLIDDLKIPLKENNKISSFINDLGQKTLFDTMENIDNFINNEIE